MKTTKIKIKNLFGISETALDGQSVEITGTNGTGKTSIIDAVRYALTNNSGRDYIIKNGENEGEILIETDTGLMVNRKKRTGQSDYKSVKECGRELTSPESFLKNLITPLQLDPVEFTQMSKKEQNRIILDLIEYDWNLEWIKEKFGEIPQGVNYEQNILQVLNDIQSENGVYFQSRQDINREIRNKRAFISDITKDIPNQYDAATWEAYDLGDIYRKIEKIKEENNKIQRAKAFKSSYDDKIRGLQAEKEISISAEEKLIAGEKEQLLLNIERMKAQILSDEEKLDGLADRLQDKVDLAESKYNESIAKLDNNIAIANEYIQRDEIDCDDLVKEAQFAEDMKKHLNEYRRMQTMNTELEALEYQSADLTKKIELARELPGEILQNATIPIDGFTVKDGIPLINDLPVSNLSEGEQLSLCVDVALSKPNSLQIILIDGAEKLSDKNRNALYEKCKSKGLQFIATRTTNDNELEVHYL